MELCGGFRRGEAPGEDLTPALLAHLDASPALWRGSLPREVLADLGAGEPEPWLSWLGGLAPAGDSTVTLGVKAEPLRHPRWREFLAGAYGVHLRTSGTGLDEAAAEVLMASPVDVVTLTMDSVEVVERLVAIQKRIGHAAPLISLEFALSREKEGELRPGGPAGMGR